MASQVLADYRIDPLPADRARLTHAMQRPRALKAGAHMARPAVHERRCLRAIHTDDTDACAATARVIIAISRPVGATVATVAAKPDTDNGESDHLVQGAPATEEYWLRRRRRAEEWEGPKH